MLLVVSHKIVIHDEIYDLVLVVERTLVGFKDQGVLPVGLGQDFYLIGKFPKDDEDCNLFALEVVHLVLEQGLLSYFLSWLFRQSR